LNPYIDEFKSGALMVRHPEQAHARRHVARRSIR